MAEKDGLHIGETVQVNGEESVVVLGRIYSRKGLAHWALVSTCCLMVALGVSGGTLLGRIYFDQGGQLRWLYTTLQTMGCPLLVLPLLICYYLEWKKIHYNQCNNPNDYPGLASSLSKARAIAGAPATPRLILIYLSIGFLTMLDNLLFAWGLSYLPVSIDALLSASQLAFNSIFSFALVRHRFTASSCNAVFAITLAALLLGVHVASDKSDIPPATSHKQYVLGFVFALGAAALYGLILPLMELTYRNIILKSTFCVILEAQTLIAIFATIFGLLGMAFSGEFLLISQEALERFQLGPTLYSLVLLGSSICWQMFFLGSVGLIFLSSSLFSCVFTTGMLPMLAILAIIVFHDPFSILKVISVVLSIWGLASYGYGAHRDAKSDVPGPVQQEESMVV